MSMIWQLAAKATVDSQGNLVLSGLFSKDIGTVFATIANLLIFLTGAASVLMIIVGGLRYVLSAGNPQAVQGAKNTILYALIGVVVSLLAFAAVRFIAKVF